MKHPLAHRWQSVDQDGDLSEHIASFLIKVAISRLRPSCN